MALDKQKLLAWAEQNGQVQLIDEINAGRFNSKVDVDIISFMARYEIGDPEVVRSMLRDKTK